MAASEPSARFVHFSAPIGAKVYLYGGCTEEKIEQSSTIHTFDVYLEAWRETKAGEPPPLGLYNGACASSGHYFYVYGGYDGCKFQDSLYRLNTISLTNGGGPMKKIGCRMVFHNDRLLLFGGFGIPSGRIQPGAEFFKNDNFRDGRGWSNELHLYNTTEGEQYMTSCVCTFSN